MEAIFRGERNYEIDKNAPDVIPWKWILPNMWYYEERIKLNGKTISYPLFGGQEN